MRLSKSNGVLLTGATGLIGCALLDRLLSIDGPAVYCLTRSMSAIQARAHLRARISQHVPDAPFTQRVEIVEGDITRPRLAMSEPAYSAVLENVDVIFHCAAVTSFKRQTQLVPPGNLNSLRKVLGRTRFAYIQRMRHYLPFMNQNVTFSRERLERDFGAPAPSVFDLARYLPQVLRRVSVESALRQSSND